MQTFTLKKLVKDINYDVIIIYIIIPLTDDDEDDEDSKYS